MPMTVEDLGLTDRGEHVLTVSLVRRPAVAQRLRAHRDGADRIAEVVRDDPEYLVAPLGGAARLPIQSRVLQRERGVRRELLGENARIGAIWRPAIDSEQRHGAEASLPDRERDDEHRSHTEPAQARQ